MDGTIEKEPEFWTILKTPVRSYASGLSTVFSFTSTGTAESFALPTNMITDRVAVNGVLMQENQDYVAFNSIVAFNPGNLPIGSTITIYAHNK